MAKEHFKAALFGTVQHIIEQSAATFGSERELIGQFPFLAGYAPEFAPPEPSTRGPLESLSEQAGLDRDTLDLWLATGIIEEDPRFGLLFEALQTTPGQHRPTIALLTAWWRDPDDCGEVRAAIRRLVELGMVQVVNPEAPRSEWALQPHPLIWDALRGDVHESLTPWLRYHVPGEAPRLGDLILPPAVEQRVSQLPGLLRSGEVRTVLTRGPLHNGRRTLLSSIAAELDLGTLEITAAFRPDDERLRPIGTLAILLDAMPVFVHNPAPGETADFPSLAGYHGPIGIVLGRHGGITGESIEKALTVHLEIPTEPARRLHWVAALGPAAGPDLDAISERFRLTGGNIRRAASLAAACAALDGRLTISLSDAREAARALNRETLETLATRMPPAGDWTRLALNPDAFSELRHLEARCRHRERLSGDSCGVRALFKGPSGTGKTLAARLLAGVLEMDLYRLDLSTVVNKYIGETEKNLSQLFSRAEELDVILLIDEGDALLTQRTAVQSSNDRYANLETNFLLQRLESFEGILIVTTNAGDRIDIAFQRRMDVVLDFPPPDPAERFAIWQLHLPAEHAVDYALLDELARRCALTGGQIRNAVLHASLLALEHRTRLNSSHVETAVRREYRKAGAVCPLRRPAQASLG